MDRERAKNMWKTVVGDWRPTWTTFAWFVVAVVASVPAWIVKHPPLQDLPFHYATLRVIHDFSNPIFAFKDFYAIDLLHTQYVLYYAVGHVLSYVMGVKIANVAMICFYLGGTPLALRWLLIALGRDERLALLVIPLLVNTMFIIGLLPYLFGIPMTFFTLACAVRWFDEPTPRRGVVLSILAVALFYAHVLPYALFGIGFIGLFPWSTPKRWIRAGLPVVPSFVFVLIWITTSDAGKSALGGLGGHKQTPLALENALPVFFQWSVNVFRDSSDELCFVLTACVAVFVLALSQSKASAPPHIAESSAASPADSSTEPDTSTDGDREPSSQRSAGLRGYVILPLACLTFYFTLGENLGEVWLFAQRFPVPFLMSLIPLLPMPTERTRRMIATSAMAAVAIASTVNTAQHFIEFEKKEVGDIDAATAAMLPGKRVAGLIYDRYSSVVQFAPFIHYVSRYQAEKGGMVLFSNAHFVHWPFRYLPGKIPYPGRVRERWEWTPEAEPMDEIVGHFDYVLTRGPGFRPPPGTFHSIFHDAHWTVWEKD